ncbi:MAG: hypothetical protein ABIB43_03990 [archaeon]
MKTELDRIPSTITLSLGLKNRIRKLKEDMTYEQYLTQLIRLRNELVHSANKIELVEFERRNLIFFYAGFKVLFDYNKLNNSSSHIFDIRIKRVLYKGEKSNLKELIDAYKEKDRSFLVKSYCLYFEFLNIVIREETKLQFNHRGRFEDYYLWEQEFKKAGLSKKSYEYDVKDRLIDYESGVEFR